MITTKDVCDIIGNKIANEEQKTIIRNIFPLQIAERMCDAIDGHEKAEHSLRFLNEYNEWYVNQLRNQVTLLQCFLCCYRFK